MFNAFSFEDDYQSSLSRFRACLHISSIYDICRFCMEFGSTDGFYEVTMSKHRNDSFWSHRISMVTS